ncbi:Protein OS-9 [Orbilia ellipsospora]|uniref:Endoplasmic reticulum lectin n=1 Tax=Orbilia ellipsospora TaxID=2528407 RepID=A0AAV9XG36_9PEZI
MVRLSSTAAAATLFALALRVTECNGMFSVHEDILAYPQYEVRFPDSPDSYITEEEADRKIASMSLRELQQHASTPSPSYPTATPSSDDDDESHAIQERDQTQHHQQQQMNADGTTVEIIYESMMMNNKRYLCSIPVVQPPPKLNATERRKNKDDEEKELARATVSGTELLKGMEGTCLYFISGWWSYSFCYNEHIKQFHGLPPPNGLQTLPPVEDPHAASYILGRAAVPDRDSKLELPKDGVMELQANGELKYLVQKLAGGTLCDITGKERRIELQYHCAPNASQDRIGYIKEVTTCCYLMVVHTPRLCKDPAFKPPADSRANTIECLEVMNEERIKEYKREKERQDANLEKLIDMVNRELGGSGGKDGKGKEKEKGYKAKANYNVRKKNAFKEMGQEYVVTGEDGREQMIMVQEVDIDAALLGLKDGVEIVDMEAFAKLVAEAGGLGGEGEKLMEKLKEGQANSKEDKEGDKKKQKKKDGNGHDEL